MVGTAASVPIPPLARPLTSAELVASLSLGDCAC